MEPTNKANRITAGTKAVVVLGAVAACVPVHALDYEVGEWLFNVDTTVSANAQWRTESRDKDMAFDEGALNFNDGNNNFDPGLVSNNLKLILELGGEYRDFSFFARADAVYDFVYIENRTDLSDAAYPSYNNGIPAGGNLIQGELPRDTIAEHGRRTRLLDAFVTYNFGIGEQSGAIRVGKQIISWGESTFYPGINALQNPIDAVAALAPGTEVREIFLPTSAIDLKWDFTSNISTEAYYKLDWKRSTLPGVGSFLSTSDSTGPGAERVLLGPLTPAEVIRRDTPDDEGQWGVIGRYVTDAGTSFELSALNAHHNIPGAEIVIDLVNDDESYTREVYEDDISLWGTSFTTTVGEAQVYLDGVYSDNMPFVDITSEFNADGNFERSKMIRGHYWQVAGGFTDIYTAFPWLSEQIVVLGEVLYQGNNLGGDELLRPPAGITPPGERNLTVTDTAWGYQLSAQLKYFSVLPGLDITVPIFFKHDVDGYGNANGLSNGLVEDMKTASIGFDAFYLSNFQFSGKYAWYWGNSIPDDRTLADRDNVSLSIKYAF
ncbi:MAG: DUF1302 family protein [Halioglobus sp.]